ncbi:hypothetical protein [Streptomyces canus]|jgi:hypothetical protein|uniref:hypothetical protein n=1 Tax=Streptomyces canus TaxID=58343 RepID=UPI0036E051CB
MGVKPPAAASAAVTEPAAPGLDTGVVGVSFGVPHAAVIIACIITAAVLAPAGLSVRDVLVLLSGAGGIGATIVLAVANGRSAGRLGRLVRAYFQAGN